MAKPIFNSGISQAKTEADNLTPMFIENPPVLLITCARYQLGNSVSMLASLGHTREEIMDMVIEALTHSDMIKDYHDSEHPRDSGEEPR